MDQPFTIGALLILHGLSFVSSGLFTKSPGNVIDHSRHYHGLQTYQPWIKSSNVLKDSSIRVEINVPPTTKFHASCEDYDNDDPRIFLYTPEGILIDTLNLIYLKDVCKTVDKYVYPGLPNYDSQTPEEVAYSKNRQQLVVTYLMAGKQPRCVQRKYRVTDMSFMAYVDRNDFSPVDCPDPLKTQAEKGVAGGGIVNLGPIGIFHDMNYIKNLETKGEIKESIFPTKDKNSQSFKLKCTEDKVSKHRANGHKDTITTAKIVLEDQEEVVVEKLELNSCDDGINGININRRRLHSSELYKIVYKSITGKCFEITAIKKYTRNMHFYDEASIEKLPTRKIRCPKTWTGDIGLNENMPWWRRLFTKPRPFMLED